MWKSVIFLSNHLVNYRCSSPAVGYNRKEKRKFISWLKYHMEKYATRGKCHLWLFEPWQIKQTAVKRLYSQFHMHVIWVKGSEQFF